MNVLFEPLNKKETVSGVVLAVIYLAVSLALESLVPADRYWVQCVFILLSFCAVLWIARRFWRESLTDIPLTGKQLIWKPLLGALVCKVICLFVQDLFLLMGSVYFVSSEWGPMLWDIRGAVLEIRSEGFFWPAAITVVLLMPVVEEFIFRGVILGSLYPRSSVLAVILSVVLFAAFHTVPYLGGPDDALYYFLYTFQYIPMGLFLAWLYISTDSIFAPILMHMIYNYVLIF